MTPDALSNSPAALPGFAANVPPDWSTLTTQLACPLCEYNLRGLTDSRCPECGFAFTWQELIEAEKTRHVYLFEYGQKRNRRNFWKTYWRTCRPRRFWIDLSPAQPVMLRRLLVYWFIATGLVTVCLAIPKIDLAVATARFNFSARASARSCINPAANINGVARQQWLDENYPLPWQLRFWKILWYIAGNSYWIGGNVPSGTGNLVIFAAWPWLTILSLLIFRYSMRQARILRVHVLRTVLYSTDFGFLLAISFLALYFAKLHLADGPLLLLACLLCAVVTTYRLTIAFKRYLRMHLPLATVFASQLVTLLVVWIALVWIADFSRQV